MSSKTGRIDEKLIDLKKQCQFFENSLKNEDNPSEFIEKIEEMMQEVLSNKFGEQQQVDFFLATFLPKMVLVLLKRGDIKYEIAQRIVRFIHFVVEFATQFIPKDSVELAEVLVRLMGQKSLFYRKYGRAEMIDEDDEIYKSGDGGKEEEDEFVSKKQASLCSSAVLVSNVKLFGKCGGFKAILDRIKNTNPKIPVNMLRFCLKIVSKVSDLLIPEFFAKYGEEVQGLAFEIMTNLTDEELKNEEKKTLSDISKSLSTIVKILNPSKVNELMDIMNLKMAYKCFKSPFLEKRLSGLNDIKEYISLVIQRQEFLTRRQSDRMMDAPAPHPMIFSIWINSKLLVEWIKEHQIVEALYGTHLHNELVKRSGEILKFLAHCGQLEKSHLDIIWDAVGKHESIRHTIFVIIAEFSMFLSVPDLDYLFEKIRKIPYNEYDSQTFNLVRNFTLNAINANINSNKKKWYGLDIFWDIIQDENPTSADIKTQALFALKEFLLWQVCHSQRVIFMEQCVNNVKNSKSVTNSYKCLVNIIATYSEKRGKKGTDSIPSVIEWLDENYSFLSLFFTEILHYKGSAKTKLAKLPQEEMENAKTTHLAQMKDRFDFLTFVLHRSNLMLTNEQIDTFWSSVIMDPLFVEERDLGFSWLENARGTAQSMPPFTDESTQYLYDVKMAQIDFSEFTTVGFSFFEFFFRYVNWSQQKFVQQDNGDHTVLSLELSGINNLWKIALEARDPVVGKQAISFINNLHKNLSPDLKPFVAKQRQDFIKNCMTNLAEASSHSPNLTPKDELRITRCLALLKTFLDEFETKPGILTQKHGAPVERGLPIKISVMTVGSTSGKYDLEMLTTDTIGQVRQKISEKMDNVPANLLRLISGGKELTDDNATLKYSHPISIHVVKRMMGKAPEEQSQQPKVPAKVEDSASYPSVILSKQEYFDQLFQLLNLEGVAQKVWDLLMLLPTNEKMFNDIFNLEKHTTNPSFSWDDLLDTRSTFKLFYSLQIVDSLINTSDSDTPEKKTQKESWQKNFLALNGLQHLTKILMTNDFQDRNKGSKRRACLALLLKILNFYVLAPQSEDLLPKLVNPPQFVSKLMELTWYAAVPTSESSQPVQPFSKVNDPLIPEAEDTQVVQYSTQLLVHCAKQKELVKCILQHPSFEEWLSSTLLFSQSKAVRSDVAKATELICANQLDASLGNLLPHSFFLQRLLAFLKLVKPGLTSSEDYFELLDKLLKRSCEGIAGGKPSDFSDLITQLIVLLKQHPVIEKRNSAVEDVVLIGLLTLTTTLVSKDNDFKLQAGASMSGGLIQEVFHNCLFNIPTSDNHGPGAPPKCKTKRSRKAAFALLTELAKDCLSNFNELVDLLMPQHSNDDKRPNVWHYIPNSFEKSTTGYVGLKNLGATCYMNSLMQQIYMIPQFRYNILSAPVDKHSMSEMGVDQIKEREEKLKENVLYQLQMMLAHLQESEKRYYDTREFCKSYKVDGQPINPLVQQDADEFFNMLFDKLENLVKGTAQEKVLKEFFGGTLLNQIISKECPHVSEREENFYTISVEVKNKKNLGESLDLYVQGDMLEGDNKYDCSTCSKKVDALKRLCLKDLPDNLIIHQKRFEFDLELMRRTKVNDYCEFPLTLSMEPYTKEGLARKENPNQNNPLPHPSSYYEYELTGILVHTGTADSGHYYSYIREREPSVPGQPKRWYHFNDTDVEPFDPKDIGKCCFGGVEPVPQWDNMQNRSIPKVMSKSYSAYMLFYERVQKSNTTNTIPSVEESKVVPKEIFSKIWDENMTFLYDKNIFDKDYFNFIWNIVQIDRSAPVTDYTVNYETIPNDPALRTIQLGTKFIINTLAHSKEKPNLRESLDYLKTLYSRHIPACKWLLDKVTKDPSWLRQILFLCSVPETRDYLSRLFVHVLSCLAPYENEHYLEADATPEDMDISSDRPETEQKYGPLMPKNIGIPKTYATRFMDSLLSLMKEASHHWQNFAHLFYIMREFAKLGPKEVAYFLSRNIVAQVIDFYLADESPYAKLWSKIKRVKMGDKFTTPNLNFALDLISHVVRSCSTQGTQVPPSQLPGEVFTLNELDKELLYNDTFFMQSLKDNIQPKATAEIAVHLAWEDENTSRMLTDVCCNGINAVSQDLFKPFQDVLTPLLALTDSIQLNRVVHFMTRYLSVIDQNLRYRNATYYSIKYLHELLPTNPLVANWLFMNLDKWVEAWIMGGDADFIRDISLTLLFGLIPGYPVLPSDGINREQMLHLAQQNLPEELMQRVRVVYRHLLSLIKVARLHWKVNLEPGKQTTDLEPGAWHLIRYWQAIRWLCKGMEEKKMFLEYVEDFCNTFTSADNLRITFDENKREMIEFFHHVSRGNSEVIELILKNEKFWVPLFDFCVTINSSTSAREYNASSLPNFYHIILECCQGSREFLEKWAAHQNFEWALRYLFLEPENGGRTWMSLLELIKICSQLASFRLKYIGFLIASEKINSQYNYVLRFFDLIMISTDEYIEFCAASGPDQISNFIESRTDSENFEGILERCLDLLNKATSWMIDPHIEEKLKTLRFNYMTFWNSKVAFAMLLCNLRSHFLEKESIVVPITSILLLLCQLDNQCLQIVVRSLQTTAFGPQQSSNEMETGTKPESVYTFVKQVLDIAFASTDRIIFSHSSTLAILYAKHSLVNATQLPSAKSYVQKSLNSPILGDAVAQKNIATSFLKLLTSGDAAVFDIPECEELAKRVVTTYFDSLTPDQKIILMKSASSFLKSRTDGLKTAVTDGNTTQMEGFVSLIIQLLKAVLAILPSSTLPEFVTSNSEIFSLLNSFIGNENFQKSVRFEEMKSTLTKFSLS